jgi:hypothetical protein
MNEFYKNKAGLPREARNANSLRDAIIFWKEKRLLHVVKACDGIDDAFRSDFGSLHKLFANTVDRILDTDRGHLRERLEKWAIEMLEAFESSHSGAKHEAYGLCGAELEKILSMK